jgi:Protein of unknown function DUF262/HNH endonuclease
MSGHSPLPGYLRPWSRLLGDTWPIEAGPIPSERDVNVALEWVSLGEVSGLAIVMYCRPEGASNAEVLAACRDTKTNRARGLHVERKMDFVKAKVHGTLRYFIGPVGSRPGPANAEPFVARSNHRSPEVDTPDQGSKTMTPSANQPAPSEAAITPVDAAEPLPDDDHLEPETEDEQRDGQDDRPVASEIRDWTISVLKEKWERGSLSLRPSFQREYVWTLRPELPSRLIESLLLESPIPPIYFGKDANNRLEMIDGQQRLTTLIDFVSNKFPLRRLNRMASLNQKYFRDLPTAAQDKILDTPIRSITIDVASNSELRYEVFERLNRGSMALNEQELRNCVFRGPFNDLLETLENDPVWRRVKGGDKPEPRFKEREIILRVFSFADRLQHYTGNLKRFLNDYMRQYAPGRPDALEAYAAAFKQATVNIYTVFGRQSARLYEVNPQTNAGGWDAKFSVTALDIQTGALWNQPTMKVQRVAEQLRELFLYMLLTDADLQLSITKATGSAAQTKIRWNKFRSLAEPIIAGTNVEPRFFDFNFRKRLYDSSHTCQLCKNEIHSLEDSTVDHIIPYSRGGKTTPENGQLAHRGCNASKNANLV